jgi:hypothetical protein
LVNIGGDSVSQETAIVKIQRPLRASAANAPWMIYDRAREHAEIREARAVPANVKNLMGTRPKAYFNAIWTADSG